MPRPSFDSARGSDFGGPEQVFDDIWWAWGTTRFGPDAMFPRNMFIIRDGRDLTVVHPVLLPEAMQARVEALGRIKNIVRLGDFHGMDDAAYVERYRPTVWWPQGATDREGVTPGKALKPGGKLPLKNASLFSFEASAAPEVALHLERHGGVLLTCDSVQCWGTRPPGCNLAGLAMSQQMGMVAPATIGPGWRQMCEPKDAPGFGPGFRALLDAFDFDTILSGHGAPLRGGAKATLAASVTAAYG